MPDRFKIIKLITNNNADLYINKINISIYNEYNIISCIIVLIEEWQIHYTSDPRNLLIACFFLIKLIIALEYISILNQL